MPNLKLMPDKTTTQKPSSMSDVMVSMSLVPILMALFQRFKEESNFSEGNHNNLYPELKQALNELDISDFDPLIGQLSTKFELMFSDEDLPDRIKEQIARLQIYLFISAIQEKELIKRSSNPARRLLDTITRTEVDFAFENQDERSGYDFLKEKIDRLGVKPFLESSDYTELLAGYQSYIDDSQFEQQDQPDLPAEGIEAGKVSEEIEDKQQPVVEEAVEPEAPDEPENAEIAEKTTDASSEETSQPSAENIKPEEPLVEDKTVSMAEAMVRSISGPGDVKKPVQDQKTIGTDKPVKTKAEDNSRANEKATEDKTETTAKPEAVKKDSRDNIYPVIQSIVTDMTLPLRVQGRSLILFDEVWSPLLFEVARTKGFKSQAWQKILTIAKTQVWVLTPKNTREELDKLISTVALIENSLSQSMQSLKLPVDQVVSLLEFLEQEQAEVIAISEANIDELKSAEKATKAEPAPKKKQARAAKAKAADSKPEKTEDVDTVDKFSSMMETGRFKKSKDMLQALDSDKSKQKVETVSADTIHKSDWVEIKKGSSTVLAKLTWRAEDRSQFIFVDREGNRVCEIDKENLNKELKAGTISLISSTPVSAARSASSIIQTIR